MKSLIVLLLVLATCVCKADNYLLKGTVGKYEVYVLVMLYEGSGCEGSFFFTSDVRDRLFEGRNVDSGLAFYMEDPLTSKNKRQDTFAMVYFNPKNGKVAGVTMNDESEGVVKLQMVPLNGQKAEEVYGQTRMGLVKKEKQETVSQDGITYTFYNIGNSPARYVQIESGLKDEVKDKINSAFVGIAEEVAENYYTCAALHASTDFSYQISNVYISKHIISIGVSGSYWCGNATIEDLNDNYNFDANTGNRLKLQDVLYVGKEPATEKDIDQEHFPSRWYTEKVVALLKKLYPNQMANVKGQYRCDYFDTDVWQYGSWYFTPKGIFLQPSFRHLNMECGEERWSVLPYPVLKQHKDPKSKLVVP